MVAETESIERKKTWNLVNLHVGQHNTYMLSGYTKLNWKSAETSKYKAIVVK